MSIYDLSNHGALSSAAARLTQPQLEAQTLVAESLLGVGPGTFGNTADDDLAAVALAMQVSLQVEAGVEAVYASNVSRGSRAIAYRGVRLHPDSVEIMDNLNLKYYRAGRLNADLWATQRGVRPVQPELARDFRESAIGVSLKDVVP